MKNEKRQKWIVLGYELISDEGLKNLSIESLSRTMNKSKSSFYNYFGEMDLFMVELLSYHIDRSKLFGNEISTIKGIRPGLVNILLEYKSDILFHKQLYLNRDNPKFRNCIERVFSIYGQPIAEKWADYFGLSHNRLFVEKFHRFIAEHFLLIIDSDNYNFNWIDNYLKELSSLLSLLSEKIK